MLPQLLELLMSGSTAGFASGDGVLPDPDDGGLARWWVPTGHGEALLGGYADLRGMMTPQDVRLRYFARIVEFDCIIPYYLRSKREISLVSA
jgi:hypothetical protein